MKMVVATTVPNNERRVIRHFERLRIDHYAPVVLARHHHNGVVRERRSFLFPGYLFVHCETNHREILTTPGVNGFLMSGDRPAMISKNVVDEIRQKENHDGHLVVEFNQRVRFRKGQMVKVKNGPFSSFNAKIVNLLGANVRVLVDLFGRKTPAVLSELDLSVA